MVCSMPHNGAKAVIRDEDFASIPATVCELGSSLEEIDRAAAYWTPRLIDPSYEAHFRSWLMKEYPRHRVAIGPISISRFLVTNGEYNLFIAASRAATPESLAIGAPIDHPVWGVSYSDADAYARWLGSASGRKCRLPTEYEWECAARGPLRLEYPFGQEFDPALCNTVESGLGTTTPVGRFGMSGYGLFDMAGNVEEWTSSHYLPYPGGSFISDDLSTSLGPYRVLRGGSFALGGDLARCARRHGPHSEPRFRYRGFRLVVEDER